MAEEQQQETQRDEQGGAGGKGTAVKAAAAAAATSVAAVAAKKALSHRGNSSGQSRNGGSRAGLGEAGSVLSSVLSSGWEAARDALVPAAEDAAGAAGDYLAKNGPDFVRERIIPRFIDSFNEARGG
ncbi:MAG TPA: hypothetical protein VE688_00805 [Gaiellaceae bacterium]|jgi:hypothetical protein|nr:hypothetical protein [Gaiellaceae bacterium]